MPLATIAVLTEGVRQSSGFYFFHMGRGLYIFFYMWVLLGIVVKRLEAEPTVISVVISAILAIIIIAIFAAHNIPGSIKEKL